jgi:capsular polysaccharide biosynthesis protein
VPDHRLRHRRLVLVALLVGAVLLPVALLMRSDEQADAQALVIAQDLDVDLRALPRYAEAVFQDGQVARAVADELGVDASGVVPDQVSLVSEPDTIVLVIIGHAEDGATAARIADVAADAYVRQLNAAGDGVGAFALQAPARSSAVEDTGRGRDTDTWTVAVPLSLTAVLAAGVVLLFTTRTRT